MIDFWNERYEREGYAYGTEPNAFFAERLLRYRPTGRLLLAAEGEGRNGVYAAEQGLDVYAFDQSSVARDKAVRLAADRGVSLDYRVGELYDLGYREGTFDALGLIYAHFPASIREAYHHKLASYLRTGGLLILEAFGSQHLAYRERNPGVGGPGRQDMLLSVAEVRRAFPDFEVLVLGEETTDLSEGAYHQGRGSVVRFVGRKL